MMQISRLRSIPFIQCCKNSARSVHFKRCAYFVPPACVVSKFVLSRNAKCEEAVLSPPLIKPPLSTTISEVKTMRGKIISKIKEYWEWFKRILHAWKRITVCGIVASSIFLLAPTAMYFKNEDMLWNYVVSCIQYLGPTFIKLGQWASSRPDMFPESLTSRLEKLQSSSVCHPWSTAEYTLKNSYGDDWEKKLHLDRKPIGSGCIAQVYKGTMKLKNGKTQSIAVKLIHPTVESQINEDMDILRAFSWVFELIPDMQYLSIKDIIEEFSNNMKLQLDLTLEAANMRHFKHDFQHQKSIDFPLPIKGYVTKNALVEV